MHHLFGTDAYGRDIFSRVIYGVRLSTLIGLITVVVGSIVGAPLGIISGYMGGIIDNLIMRIIDIILSFPSLMLAMVIAVSLGQGIRSAVVAVAFCSIPGYARLIRSEVLGIREEAFVEAAVGLGESRTRIMLKHILPNTISTIIVRMSLDIGSAVLIVSSLSFIGVGAQEPLPELGLIITSGRHYIVTGQWWLTVFPGMAIAIIVLGFNLLGDFSRDYLNPRLRTKRVK
jgi:peptide/nickel transport system permease protein